RRIREVARSISELKSPSLRTTPTQPAPAAAPACPALPDSRGRLVNFRVPVTELRTTPMQTSPAVAPALPCGLPDSRGRQVKFRAPSCGRGSLRQRLCSPGRQVTSRELRPMPCGESCSRSGLECRTPMGDMAHDDPLLMTVRYAPMLFVIAGILVVVWLSR